LDIRSDVIGMMSNSKYQKVKLECERVIQHSIYRHDYKNRFGHFERVDGNVTTFSSAPKPCGANCPLCRESYQHLDNYLENVTEDHSIT
jgi:hypothetical protein